MSIEVTISLNCFSVDENLAQPNVVYQRYDAMRAWLSVNQVKHKFIWNDPGRFYPNAVTMDDEAALAFRLTYNV